VVRLTVSGESAVQVVDESLKPFRFEEYEKNAYHRSDGNEYSDRIDDCNDDEEYNSNDL
jgi:hypothetical protein